MKNTFWTEKGLRSGSNRKLCFSNVTTQSVDCLDWKHNNTWELVALSPGKSTVGYKWVYTIKVNPNGIIEQLKAHLVAKRHT